jgi:hypothetical protein
MVYIIALSFLLFGIIIGYVFGDILDRQEEYLSLSRKSLERLLAESNITEDIDSNEEDKKDLEG